MATNSVRTLKDVTSVVLSDDDGTNEITLDCEQGNISFDLPDTHGHASDRGAPGNLYDGEFQPISWSMTLYIKEISGTEQPLDVFTCTASGWDFDLMDTSTGDYSALTLTAGTDTIASTGGVGVFQMRVTVTDPGDASTEVLYFANNTASVNFSEAMPSTITVSGTCYMTASAFMANINAS